MRNSGAPTSMNQLFLGGRLQKLRTPALGKHQYDFFAWYRFFSFAHLFELFSLKHVCFDYVFNYQRSKTCIKKYWIVYCCIIISFTKQGHLIFKRKTLSLLLLLSDKLFWTDLICFCKYLITLQREKWIIQQTYSVSLCS